MTVQELMEAKREFTTVVGPFGNGKVSDIGRTHTYIHYLGNNKLCPFRVLLASNDEITPQN